MPLGPFGEILGTTGTLDALGEEISKYESKVIAPRNPKLVRGEEPELKMTPSQFLFQMSLDTTKKMANTHSMHLPKKLELLDMSETTHQKFSTVEIEESIFQPFPSEIFFMNCEPHETHEIPLLLRNNDKVPRLVKVTQADSPYFKVVAPTSIGNKVAAGLSATFTVLFTPDERRDYSHELVCITEREKFIVPVRCIGARAILDFPDQVHFGATPVKHTDQKVLFVRNVGNREAKVFLTTEKPFSVTPASCVLNVNESIQVTVEYTPQNAKEHLNYLVIHYDTGEKVYVNLYGLSQDVAVRLDKQSVRVENTYVGLANQRVVTLHNRSDVIAKFRWTRFPSHLEEEMEREMMLKLLGMEQDSETVRFMEECNSDPSLKDKLSIVSRTFLNRKRLLENDGLLFEDDVVKMDPVEGQIWPNSSREVTVTFKPSEALEYTRHAFCDVTGRETRLALKVTGVGVGPKIQFSFHTLDLGFIFVGSSHTYELLLVNKGDIDAMYRVHPSGSAFCQCFKFMPDDGLINPGGHQAIHISFKSTLLGDFCEEFKVMFDACPEPVKITFKGSVIGPTFHFDQNKLKFGTVSYGFPSQQRLVLHNTSLVPMTFKLHVPGDGVGAPMLAHDLSSSCLPGDSPRGRFSIQPRQEFDIQPARGVVEAMSSIVIEVILVANSIRKFQAALVVDIDEVGPDVLTLPISAKSVVPPIHLATPVLHYSRCFLDYPYEKLVKLDNDSDLPARYDLIPQQEDLTTDILYMSPQPNGIIEPRSSVEVLLVILARGREEISTDIYFKIFGSDDTPLEVEVQCYGEGPVVCCNPEEMDWGTVTVLADNPKTMILSNESLINAKFSAKMLRPDTVFFVEPSTGEIEAQKSVTLKVIARLNDCMRFQDKLQVFIEDSQTKVVPLTAIGTGSTIAAQPPLEGRQLNLGAQFSRTPFRKVFTLTNKGRRHQQVVWTTEGYSHLKAAKQAQSMNNALPIQKPVFSVSPHRFDLIPGESIDIELCGQVDIPQVIKERLLCHAIIGRSGGKELIKKLDVCVDFIAPILEFSNKTITFTVDKKVDDVIELQTKDLELKNVSGLALTLSLKLNHPFQLLLQDDSESSDMIIHLDIGESCRVQVQFDPLYKKDTTSRSIEEALTVTYAEHPHTDLIQLIGEVNFPNLTMETDRVDFGCILNHTEVTRYLNMVNTSPLPVKYRWSFVVGDSPNIVFHREQPTSRVQGLSTQTFQETVYVDEKETDKEMMDAMDKDKDTEKGIVEALEGEKEEECLQGDGSPVPPLDLPECDPPSPRLIQESTTFNLTARTARGEVHPALVNPKLSALMDQDHEVVSIAIEEVFDVLPLYGEIGPGKSQRIDLTFFGHADIEAQVTAICEVEGGPTYQVQICGEASFVEYNFDSVELNYNKIPYDQVAVAYLGLYNNGKVGFNFTAGDEVISYSENSSGKAENVVPMRPMLSPSSGFVEAHSFQRIAVRYLPGVPEIFDRSFNLQVAHFQADTIHLRGEGTFPRVSLDLPRLSGPSDTSRISSGPHNPPDNATTSATTIVSHDNKTARDQNGDPSARCQDDHLSELQLQLEMERVVVQQFAESAIRDPLHYADKAIMAASSALKLGPVIKVHHSGVGKKKKETRHIKAKPVLPFYILDFGYVVLGHVKSLVFRATNTGFCAVSLWTERDHLGEHGFTVDPERVKHLPGAPTHETLNFVVNFDPRGANLGQGPVETILPLNIVNGPYIPIILRAHVTMPELAVNNDVVEFEEVRCGEAKVITVQLHNPAPVAAQWTSLSESGEGGNSTSRKMDKFTPMHLRRKSKNSTSTDKPLPPSFEMIPVMGHLKPGQRMNVQIKFMPTEDKAYQHRIALRLAQSSQRLLILCRGTGLEPRLEFDQTLVHFGPILPFSNGDERNVIVRNPCNFPIEFYNVQFDEAYLEEEKVLRQMVGYDEYNTLLLPPRQPGEGLPGELTEYYEEQVRKVKEAESATAERDTLGNDGETQIEQASSGQTQAIPLRSEETGRDTTGTLGGPPDSFRVTGGSQSRAESEGGLGAVGELEVTPVSMAIARYLGIDLSPEGKAARNRRGIAIIVHGAPQSGKSSTAVMLAKRYEAALLTVDAIVIDAISNGNTAAGLRAREMCAEAARRAAVLEAQAQAASEQHAAEPEESGDAPKKSGGLSVEAVTAHTQGQGVGAATAQSMAQSMASNRKTSTVSGQGHAKHPSKESHPSEAKKIQQGSNVEAAPAQGQGFNQGSTSPPPLTAPIAKRLRISASRCGEESLMSTILPENLLIEIVSERLLLNDCHCGVVFDSLDTLFSPNMTVTAQIVLKALNNRRYIFAVSLKQDLASLRAKASREAEAAAKRAQEEEAAELRRLEEMSEDEYDGLDEDEKRRVDEKRLAVRRERRQKELNEKAERERLEKEQMEAQLRKMEEEKATKKKGGAGKKDDKGKPGPPPASVKSKDPPPAGSGGAKDPAKMSLTRENTQMKSQIGGKPEHERPESHATEKSDGKHDPDKRKGKSDKSKENEMGGFESSDEVKEVPMTEEEKLLAQKFKTFDVENRNIVELFQHWDRTILAVKRPPTPSDKSEFPVDETHLAPAPGANSGKKGSRGAATNKKSTVKDHPSLHTEKTLSTEKPESKEPEAIDTEQTEHTITVTAKVEEIIPPTVNVPNLIVDCSQLDTPAAVVSKVQDLTKLPTAEEVLDGLGLGSSGPPIPPPATFAIVSYPIKRRPPQLPVVHLAPTSAASGATSYRAGGSTMMGHYQFVASSPDDPNLGHPAVDPQSPEQEEKAPTPDKLKEEGQTTSRTVGRGSKKEAKDASAERGSSKDKGSTGSSGATTKETSKKAAAAAKKAGRRPSDMPSARAATPASDEGMSPSFEYLAQQSLSPLLGIFRWIVPAQGEIVIRLRFKSEELGQFDQTLNFEITGLRRRYQLYCRGICAFPSISREPRVVFPHRKKSRSVEEIVHKKYILNSETFEFGPLFVEKLKEKVREGRYPDNVEHITIQNTSPMEADISFCLLNDIKSETFAMDPPSLQLLPGESHELTVWAHPRGPGRYEDAIVCCVKENPEPILFKIACDGVRPELELDKKVFHFDRVLLHRKDTKTIYLRNSTLLPVTWKMCGLETLGEDFSIAQDAGTIEAKSELALNAYFRAVKPYKANQKKSLRLEVYDSENIAGLVQVETIQVLAEAYDVALDMAFPKGADGGIDFGVNRVGEESKQAITLRNKGPYEIIYNFVLKNGTDGSVDASKLFSIFPQRGTLSSGDKAVAVQVVYKSKDEVTIKDQAILVCQVIEPNVAEGGELIASIPILISVRSVFSKFAILPQSDINFGALIVQCRKSRQFMIENRGEFDFKFNITRMSQALNQPTKDLTTLSKDKQKPHNTSERQKQQETAAMLTNQARLVVGMFTISPGSGAVPVGSAMPVTVECIGEMPGKSDEELCIEITDRNPKQYKHGIPYRLIAEACIPSINTTDITSIFEEHRICQSLNFNHMLHQYESGGLFGEEENRFVFPNVIVGSRSRARFRISNSQKVPCDIVFSVRSTTQAGTSGAPAGKQTAIKSTSHHGTPDVFEVEPTRAQILPHSSIYVTVTFMPAAMQLFTAQFEANVEATTTFQSRLRPLTFDIHGEGNLPQVHVTRPNLRNKRSQPLCLFRKLLIGQHQSLPLVLENNGYLPSRVDLDLVDPDSAFTILPGPDNNAIMNCGGQDNVRHPHTASLTIDVGKTATFEVVFKPTTAVRSVANIKVAVINNQYEDAIVQLIGEGYQDDVTIDNIPFDELTNLEFAEAPQEVDDTKVEEDEKTPSDEIQAARNNHLNFGDIAIGDERCLSFSLTNHSTTDTMRFQWPASAADTGYQAQIKFSPSVGHLQPGQSKHIVATLTASTALTLTEKVLPCKLIKITANTGETVSSPIDWDDTKRTMKWIDVLESRPDSSKGPRKRKVIEVEEEPPFTEVAETSRNIDLLVSMVTDHTKFECKMDKIKFRETLMFQTRHFDFPLKNTGTVSLPFQWYVQMHNPPTPFTPRASFTPDSQSLYDDASALCPISIEPPSGTIPPGETSTMRVRYSPLSVGDVQVKLTARIDYLDAGVEPPSIAVSGKSEQPFCHFELEDSDYLTAARRNPELRGPNGTPAGTTLDPNTRVIEIDSVGIGGRITKRFGVINPTRQDYNFNWVNEDLVDVKIPSSFNCDLKDGCIQAGKKFEMRFEFLPQRVGIVESFWRFNVPDLGLSVPFLLVCQTREPGVSLDRSHFNYRSLLVGHEATEVVHIINPESDSSFFFTIKEETCHAPGHVNSIRVEPLSGTIPPKSKIPLQLFFTPKSEKEVNFNVQIRVQGKQLPLNLNVKADGYTMKSQLWLEDRATGHRFEVPPAIQNGAAPTTTSGIGGPLVTSLNFGDVEIHETASRTLIVVNSGKFNFDVNAMIECPSRPEVASMFSLTPSSVGVKHGEKVTCQLDFRPNSRVILRHCQLILRISNGPTYTVTLVGSAVPPGIHFSLSKHDFGPCFVYRPGMQSTRAPLTITNTDRRPLNVDVISPPCSWLQHDFEPKVMQPGQTITVNVTFLPREAIKYSGSLEFEVNSTSRHTIAFSGQGTEPRIEVQHQRQRVLRLGVLREKERVNKTVPIVNNSLAPVTFNILLNPSSSGLLQEPTALQISPLTPLTLPGRGGVANVEVTFAPSARVAAFSEEVMMEWSGVCQPLFAISGACHGYDVILDHEGLAFGAVVKGSQITKKLVMTNVGDIGSKFNWDVSAFAPDFSISPSSGYISPGMDLTFDVIFCPTKMAPDIRYNNLKCHMEGWRPLNLTLTGMCIAVTPVKETQQFLTHVRQKDSKLFPIMNKTNALYVLKPHIDGEYWSGAETHVVEPQTTKPYELTYRPLTMTTDGKKHTATVFFALPDGTGLLYNVVGTSEPPKPSSKITRDVPCKTPYTEILQVENWLPRTQRFKVTRELMKPDKLDPGTHVKGLDYIDVPGEATRDYKLNFLAHKEGQLILKVTFTNEQTGEYQFHELLLKAIRPGPVGAVRLTTPVRQPAQHVITLDNPLHTPVMFQVVCTLPEIHLPAQLQIPPQSQGSMNLEFLPLRVGDYQGRLEFSCNELGLYIYDLDLNATPAALERTLYMKTHIGLQHTLTAKFVNHAKAKMDFACKLDSGEFHCDKLVTAAPGVEVSVDVTYEPTKLGDTRANLIVSSSQAGEFTFPLHGTALLPKPQGPFTVKAGSTINITFRNVFAHTTPYTFQVDNPAFHVNKSAESLRAHKDYRLVVGFDGGADGGPVMGKLIVSCVKSAGNSANLQWTFYLRGLPN